MYDIDSFQDSIESGEKWSCAFADKSLYIKMNGDILGFATCTLAIDNLFSDTFNLQKFWQNNQILNKVRDKKNLNGICGDDFYCPIVNGAWSNEGYV